MFILSQLIEDKRVDAVANISKAQSKQKVHYDLKHKGSYFKAGDKVLKKNFYRANRQGGKQEDKWRGPFTIVEATSKGTYFIEQNGVKCAKPINGMYLKLYYSPERPLPNTLSSDDSTPVMARVKRLCAERQSSSGCPPTAVALPLFDEPCVSITSSVLQPRESVLDSNYLVDDDIVRRMQQIFKMAFPFVSGLRPPLEGIDPETMQACAGFSEVPHNINVAVQIHYLPNHWVVSAPS